MAVIYPRLRSDELSLSRDRSTLTLNFVAIDFATSLDVLLAVEAQSPPVFLGLIRSNIDIRANEDNRTYDVAITYSAEPDSDPVSSNPPSQQKSGPSSDSVDLSFGWSITAETQEINLTSAKRQARVGVGPPQHAGNNNMSVVAPGYVSPGIPTNNDQVGKCIFIIGGPQVWKRGGYRIVAIQPGNTWELDSLPAPIGSTGGVWIMPADAPDYDCAINVTDDGIAGVSALAPSGGFERRVSIPVFSVAYFRNVLATIAKVNQHRFYHFEPGEVLYLGCTAEKENAQAWRVTHKFKVELNRANIRISENLTVPFKRGHEYLWVKYRPVSEFGIVIQKPIAAYVAQVYDYADFSVLGIGT